MKLLFVGDVVLDREIKYSQEFLDIVSGYDHCIANLEAPFIGDGSPVFKAGVWINSEEKYVSSLRSVFDTVTLANNHMMDYGERSLSYTSKILDDHGFNYCGAGKSVTEAHEPVHVGDCFIFSIAENEFGCSSESGAGIACFDDLNTLYDNIKKYSKLGKVIVCYHGGTEEIPLPPKYLRDRFSLLKSFGADIIIGHHPHVVQGSDINSFYSLGNFYFIRQNGNGYDNIDWSLVVGYDTETDKVELYFVSVIDDTVVLVEKENEFEFLNEMLHDEEYENLSNIISLILYDRWYNEFRTSDNEVMLHYFRCDSHKNNLIKGLSYSINELSIHQSKKYKIQVDAGDAIRIRRMK